MTSLESYLRGPYKDDGLFLKRLLDKVEEVIPLFYKQKKNLPVKKDEPDDTVVTWPYAVAAGEGGKLTPTGESFSASTHCMILFALDAFSPRGKDEQSLLLGKGFRACKLSGSAVKTDKMQRVIDSAKKTLLDILSRDDLKQPIVKSGTYGENDPFTLTWLTEIVFRFRPEEVEELGFTAKQLDACKKRVREAVGAALTRKTVLETSNTAGEFSEVPGSFLELRRLHLAKAATILDEEPSEVTHNWLEKNAPDLWSKFDSTIHRQLSFSAMGDPKFDPAELTFAFEGALLIHPTWVGRPTVDKVFEALKLSRNRHPYWRPVTPFLANDRGHILFLVSVEVANSILRACEILDDEDARLTTFSQFEEQLRAYATWLFGEVEEIADQKRTEPNLVGWRTEYEEKRDTIQLWHTSHVLVFLSHYASLLKRKIAADGVEAAGLHVRMPDVIEDYWSDEPLRHLATIGDKHYAVLRQIREKYILARQLPGRENGASKSEPGKDGEAAEPARATPLYSMLLYGPPGTGKTTVAEQLAATLKRPLIVVTVSDFLAAGAADIENRAKGVFEVLRAQEEVVILFDEIDQFLLDRNSKFYREQDDVFKFMTPGMLTKLQDLRDAENSIFIVATNYYERIDSAIKRRGRIDEHFLLCIPDQRQRLRILQHFTRKVFKRIFADEQKRAEYKQAAGTSGPAYDFYRAVTRREFRATQFEDAVKKRDILRDTALFGWGDLKNLVESKTEIKAGMDFNSFADAMAKDIRQVDSAVSLGAYHSRFDGDGPPPFEEFFLLLYLAAESEVELNNSDKRTIYHFMDAIPDFQGDDFKQLEKSIKEAAVRREVEKYMKDILADWKTIKEQREKAAAASQNR